MGRGRQLIVGQILGHTQAQTIPRFAHLADDPLRKALDRVASSLKEAMDGGAAKSELRLEQESSRQPGS